MTRKNLVGKKFGKLTVIKEVEPAYNKLGYRLINWLCRCDCGKERIIKARSLNMKNFTKSCGCIHPTRYKSKEYGLSSRNKVFDSYKQKAKKKNLLFELTLEQFDSFSREKCFYCGSLPYISTNYKRHHGQFTYTGIDRINNNLGYILSNVRPCCKNCNYAKNTLTEEIFFKMIKNIYEKHLI